MKKKIFLWIGIAILLLLGVSYFITITSVEENGLLVERTETPLLGVLIFHNPFVLGLYILVGIVFIVKGVSGKHIKVYK